MFERKEAGGVLLHPLETKKQPSSAQKRTNEWVFLKTCRSLPRGDFKRGVMMQKLCSILKEEHF
ncbi:MAG: hypothetical protein DWI13_02295 [Planctomycetota bacterium]|nr:MAG: hypothetical protein DWI13_02295 [Planctomycetota bacterium]